MDPVIAVSAVAAAGARPAFWSAPKRGDTAGSDGRSAAAFGGKFQQQPVGRRAVVAEERWTVVAGGHKNVDPAIVIDVPEAGALMDTHIVRRQSGLVLYELAFLPFPSLRNNWLCCLTLVVLVASI